MKTHRWTDIKKKRFTPAQIAKLDKQAAKELLEMDLAAMRKMLGKTQVETAKAIKMTQGQLSTLENNDDHLLSTLRRYVKGLGGELEVVARFGDKTIRLHGV